MSQKLPNNPRILNLTGFHIHFDVSNEIFNLKSNLTWLIVVIMKTINSIGFNAYEQYMYVVIRHNS